MSNPYYICAATVQIKDKDIYPKEIMSVAMPVEVQESQFYSEDEDDARRYKSVLADETVKKALPEVLKETELFVDFKMAIGDIEVIDCTFTKEMNNVILIPAVSTAAALRERLEEVSKANLIEAVSEEFATIAPIYSLLKAPVPAHFMISTREEYDAGDSWSEIDEVEFYNPLKQGNHIYTDARTPFGVCTENDYQDSLSNAFALKLQDYIGVYAVQEAKAAGQVLPFKIEAPTKEQMEKVKDALYYWHDEWIYDPTGDINIKDGHKEEYNDGIIIPYREIETLEKYKELRKELGIFDSNS